VSSFAFEENGTMDTSDRSLGKEDGLLITVRIASVEGLAEHAARVGTEVG